MQTKVCNVCQKDLPVSNFYFRKERNEYRGNCKKCKPLKSKSQISLEIASRTEKVCKICGISKPLSEYNTAGKGRWTQPYCKPCDTIRKRVHTQNNIEYVVKKRKEYYRNNAESICKKTKENWNSKKEYFKEKSKEYRDKNKHKKRETDRQYRLKKGDQIYERRKAVVSKDAAFHKARQKAYRDKRTPEQREKLKRQQKEYRLKNKDKIRETRKRSIERTRERNRIYNNKKSATDIEFRILKNLRSRTRFALKKWNTIKSDTTENLLGCSIPFFKEYFTSLFSEGMTWDLFMSGDIHIDHIKPCSKFDLRLEEDQRACFHYTNLQPLWQLDNLKKGVSFDESIKKQICQSH